MKVSFVVVNENIFGYVTPAQSNQVGVLASSTIRGASHHWMNGPMALPVDGKGVRPATKADFEDYRIGYDQYANDAEYDIPLE